MNRQHHLWLLMIFLLLTSTSFAQKKFVNEDAPDIGNAPAPNKKGAYRAACIESKAFTELNINNVRARLRAGGDMWWDGAGTAQYIVPNVDPASGEPEVSSLFASAIWLGAYDDGGNLILAAQTYRGSGNDYWTGPLDPTTGTVEKSDCELWDRHFTVYGDDITSLRGDILEDGQVDVKPSKGLLSWPARGNPHFSGIFGWELPDQNLAPFIDYNGDGIYDPWDGDHPIIEVGAKDRYSEPCGKDYISPVYADQMVWWVYNDNGDIHGQSNGEPMKMEIQVTAFGYRSTDAINNMTFYRYKLLNRNALTLSDTYFSLWSDPDLGCFQDDYIGCDTVTGMGYVYNADAVDDNPCGTSTGNGYGAAAVPALGVDYFRGPIDSSGNQIGLSSFQYHVTSGAIGAPSSAIGYYRLISGKWPDGTNITQGNNGYNVGSTDPSTPYVFPSWPNDKTGGAWSMCSENLSGLDQRFMHTSGPFILKPGATNEMITGVVWVPEIPDYPCPSLKQLVEADQLAQNLFDNCFKITDGPDAPFIDIVELEKELILNLGYTNAQNNFRLGYEESPGELSPYAPLDTTYNFQGYKVYQVNDPNISVTDLEDEEKARLIFQTDVKDNIGTIINWEKFADEDIDVSIPTVMVEGENEGLKHTFRIVEDQFAAGEKDLINHKPYYFCVVAYAHNEYKAFDPSADASEAGQDKPYLQGRRNFRIYTGIPRKTDPEYQGLVLNSVYGDQPGITRLEGKGTGGGNFLEISNRQTVEDRIFDGGATGEIDYFAGRAPISVKVVDPLRVPKGTFRLYVCDNQYSWRADTTNGGVVYSPVAPDSVSNMSDSTYWVLADVNDPTEIWTSFQTIDQLYEQYIPDLGISVTVEDATLPGLGGETGYVGSELIYSDTTQPAWFGWVADQSTGLRNMLKTGNSQSENAYDPESLFSETETGFYPFMLADCRLLTDDYYLTVGHIGGGLGVSNSGCGSFGLNSSNTKVLDSLLTGLNNVNVVMTPDTAKWSRCVVLETASRYYSDPTSGLGLTVPSGLKHGDWKRDYPGRTKTGALDSDTLNKGLSWFPGYAYDVETGERLNIFFGENSVYNGFILPEADYPGSSTGNDMLYNPSNRRLANPKIGFISDPKAEFLASVYGGQHVIYVTRTKYDSCKTVIDSLNPTSPNNSDDFELYQSRLVSWASMSYVSFDQNMLGDSMTIPPSELTIKLRAKRPFNLSTGTNENKGYPLYQFSLDGFAPSKEENETAVSALDLIRVVPNPYYAYSDYEVTEINNAIKITNIPGTCKLSIYSIDGQFIRKYDLAQGYNDEVRTGIARVGQFGSSDIENQVLTSVEWDLKNSSGVPVGSGVYLIHVTVEGVGEKVLKSFIINRAFDAQRL